MFENYFKFKQNKTNLKTEVTAGITTFDYGLYNVFKSHHSERWI